MLSEFTVQMNGRLRIYDLNNCEMLIDKKNAIHSQNMARILARGLAREGNSFIHRLAFGNGGTVTDPTGTRIFNPPNDGINGNWESRLYNETYSEIVDEDNINFGSDPGSAEPGNIRTGGGSAPLDDIEGSGVVSQEVGSKSNVVITLFLNENEPSGQIADINSFGIGIDQNETTFSFDEIGLYSSGLGAAPTSGHSSINVGNRTSEDVSLLATSSVYVMNYIIDGVPHSSTLNTQASGSGSAGTITYGDIAQALNTGLWDSGGDSFKEFGFVFITDRTNGTYDTITNRESYGFLTFQSKTTGMLSSISLICDSEDTSDFLKSIANGICADVGINQQTGQSAGVLNDSIDQSNERERLLTHITFPPIVKTADKALKIEYTLTLSVARTNDSRFSETTITG